MVDKANCTTLEYVAILIDMESASTSKKRRKESGRGRKVTLGSKRFATRAILENFENSRAINP